MECVNCGINLLKKEAKMNDYCKASVEVLVHTPELVAVFPLHVFMQAVDPLAEAGITVND